MTRAVERRPPALRRAPLQGGAGATFVADICVTDAMAVDKGYVFLGCADGRVLRILER